IVAKVTKADEKDTWNRQWADALSAAAQSSPAEDTAAMQRLTKLKDAVVKQFAGSSLAAYVTFRELQADYSRKLQKTSSSDFAKVQQEWVDSLSKFVQAYPQADDTPDALLQLGMVNEFLGKEIEARKWYQQLASSFANKQPHAAKAAGALKRLELEGKVLELQAPMLGTTSPFNIATLRSKFVVVYYWASWNQQCVGDFAKLKLLLDS